MLQFLFEQEQPARRSICQMVARCRQAKLLTEHMERIEKRDEEAAAVARIADAAREVQLASAALEGHFQDAAEGAALTLMLARLTAAMSEMQAARDAFDALLAAKGSSE